MAEQYVRINGKTFLYKQKAPFVASGMSVRGGIEYDPEEDKLRCHECGDWFENLGRHSYLTHGISSRDYKDRHGLWQKTALINEKLGIASSIRMTATLQADPAKFRESRLRGLAKGRGHHRLKPGQFEDRNARSVCPAQLLSRIERLAQRLGRTPTVREFEADGISIQSAYLAFNIKDRQAVMSLANLVPRGQGFQIIYSDPVLTEALRDFYVCHGRLPRLREHRRGLLPSRTAFKRAFGTMGAAYRAAGLGLVAAAGGT